MTESVDLLGALQASIRQVRDLRGPAAEQTVVVCRCGAREDRGRDVGEPADLRDEDVTLMRNEGIHRCRACPHAIHHGAPCVATHMTNTSVVRDHYHVACALI